MSENKVRELKLIIVLYLLMAHKNQNLKFTQVWLQYFSEKEVCGGVDPIKGFLTDRMRVSIFHQVLQNGQ